MDVHHYVKLRECFHVMGSHQLANIMLPLTFVGMGLCNIRNNVMMVILLIKMGAI